ncbi:NADH dehydrogenase subunit 4L (mitochondrion) [Caenorhabditis elegans]|uniref:NADH-ubiquinone oxidoreductase chain 4L n=4 Tax=Caenorhabditis TaxID=6237 RepID=NU4LM_CAEEL|nr:NADH dehydrogenase subunit 4L [Caenorhabditis elegans]YP_009391018.1 NADH dehydrogenase subunit 4L [Caenorhabditis doughertyi]P24886.2 RecName: Full=NADH-ubiquinone oxidoreductase chain 4L; AltName: Full=NADH dehydrogenase subunit 4L [Caenorhabditis elegans]AAO16386.1 NADH dehydrogenase subunit 4L [Caenorhabditis elegans]AAO16389.1 NADH dehydrogenase subunit 4L [Caenorhabditis elegans]AAO16392.1 NADH dehydrogenase subunit 4L [Caenorhabditis elegans]AAO16395.1 NADH dehydrogenase subunit 4L |eukprot:NP_006954.1 NADH dehydrogenase subunit 4L (mitochondrion) [Caenorhabditis elegans]
MMFLFVSLFMFIFKWQRLIFILISLEFMMLSLFLKFSYVLGEMMFFYFMCFSVISSILGMVVMVGNMKFFGSDNCIF